MNPKLSIVFFALALTGCGPANEAGKGLASVDWLPPAASDITFVRNSGLFWDQTYECKMAKFEFDAFALKNNLAPVPKKDMVTGFRSILGLPTLIIYYRMSADYYYEALVYKKIS